MSSAIIVPLKAAVRSVALQRTLGGVVRCDGIGLHSGAQISMTLHPAPEDHGIIFVRTDLSGADAVIPALWSHVRSTVMNSGLINEAGAQVGTVEHLMSALAACGIDNCLVKISGAEVPVMDGSSQPFLHQIDEVGIVEQIAPRRAIRILRPVSVSHEGKIAAFYPADHGSFSLHFEIDFPCAAIARQERTLDIRDYRAEVSRARTFGFEQEVAALRAAGLGRGGSLDNAVVIDATGTKVLNEGGLRYKDEFVRHKILDAVGDLYLAGAPILGHFHGVKSGHALNNKLLHALFADEGSWEWTTMSAEAVNTAPMPLAANG